MPVVAGVDLGMSAQPRRPSSGPRTPPSAKVSPEVFLVQAQILAAVVDGAVLRGTLVGVAGQLGATVADLTAAIDELSAAGWVVTQSGPYDLVTVRWERRVAADGWPVLVERRRTDGGPSAQEPGGP